ncbi:glutaredoxin [Actimicrobium sp. GrIS 1.19]|uniref:glutaredoxin family protein n=1 Tax=Actimicrobium sp. GrIS 1.19 TaxID=3071708 RepID=UPI002DFC9594|nr:glutaredoxin [Actimicrobium sp. GrIS 1.19]
MKRIHKLVSVLLLLGSASVSAQQMYKWVGADGKVNYTDTPPPASVKRVESKEVGSAPEATSPLPYELAQSAKASPVTLYTTAACPACDDARALLTKRGIPFAEKTVTTSADAERLKQAGGNGTIPMLLIGRVKQIGFEAGAVNTALSAAGYPENSVLPTAYRNAAATAAAPVAVKLARENAQPAPAAAVKAPAVEAPAGFRF